MTDKGESVSSEHARSIWQRFKPSIDILAVASALAAALLVRAGLLKHIPW